METLVYVLLACIALLLAVPKFRAYFLAVVHLAVLGIAALIWLGKAKVEDLLSRKAV